LLKTTIEHSFLPALFQSNVEQVESSLMMLSCCNGGLGIRDPVATSVIAFQSSIEGTKILSESIQSGTTLEISKHEAQMSTARNQAREIQNEMEETTSVACLNCMPKHKQGTLKRIKEGDCSTWLSMILTQENQFIMSADEFRDSMALRYTHCPIKMHGFCDGCSSPFDVNHALNCKKGGLVVARHNESRDLNIDLLKMTGLSQLTREPILKESDSDGKGGLRLDWGVRGFWEFQREALFDIRIINADATSYCTSLIQSLFDDARNEKRSKYGPAAEDRRACFTPILATCEAIFDHEAIVYMKRLATLLASKWSKHYSQIYGWLKARMQVCVLRSVSLCIRGSRTHWRGAGIEDGAQIPTFACMF